MEEKQRRILLNNYLDRDLSDNEAADFAQLVETDEEFAEEVELVIIMNATYNTEKKKHWQELLAKQQSNATPVNSSAKVHAIKPARNRILLRVAAVLFIGILSFVIYLNLNNSSTVPSIVQTELSSPYPAPVILMDSGSTLETNRKAAIKAYQEQKYNLTIPLLETLITQQPENGEIHFYLALSHLYDASENYPRMFELFEKSQQLDPSFTEKVNWYKSLILIRQGKTNEATGLLKGIVQKKSWKYKSAKTLLGEIEK